MVGLALLERRAVAIGFAASVVVVVINQGLIGAGVLAYGPAVVPGTFARGMAASWWEGWRSQLLGQLDRPPATQAAISMRLRPFSLAR